MGRNLADRAAAATNTAQQGTDVVPMKDRPLRDQVRAMEKAFQAAMPRGAEAQQLVRDALTCIQQNPKLEQASINSVLGALMTCAQLGLRPGVLGHAWVLPYREKGVYVAKLILGYQGLVDLAYRSERVTSIAARTVFEHDHFELSYGADVDVFVHRPSWQGQRGQPIAYYAVARTLNGGYTITDPVSHDEMLAYRDKHAPTKYGTNEITGPWVSEFEGMAHKTMIRRAMKLLPKSTDMARALAHDDAVRLDYTPAGIDTPPSHIEGEVIPDDDDAQGGDQPVDNGPQLVDEDTHDHLVLLLDGMGYTDTESRGAWAGRVVKGARAVSDIEQARGLELIADIQGGKDPGFVE